MPFVTELPAHAFSLSVGGSVMTATDEGVLAAFGAATEFVSYEPDAGHDGSVRPGDGLAFTNIDGDPAGPSGTFRGTVAFTVSDTPDLIVPDPRSASDIPHIQISVAVDTFHGLVLRGDDGRLYVVSQEAVGHVGVTARVRMNGVPLPAITTSLGGLAADICTAASLAGEMAAKVHDFARRVPAEARVAHTSSPHDTFTPPSDSVVCFIAGTSIRTSTGAVAVEGLRVGDLVATRNRQFQPIRWVGAVRVTRPMLQAMPNLRPIRIRAGALGRGTPAQDLLVSPQHRVQVTSAVANDMFAAQEVLIAAKHLVGVSGIEVALDVTEVTYCHVLCNDPDIVHADGAEPEAAGNGNVARHPIDTPAQREIVGLFPKQADSPARPFPMAGHRADWSGAQRTGTL